MKHLRITLSIMILWVCSFCAYSQSWEPVITDIVQTKSSSQSCKSYVVKYTTYKLGEKTALNPVNMPLEITNDRITVYNTRSGKKYWEVNYLGVVTMSKYNNFEFHKYYLVNKGVYFYISVKRVFTGPGDVLHYMIEFDGELQFAV